MGKDSEPIGVTVPAGEPSYLLLRRVPLQSWPQWLQDGGAGPGERGALCHGVTFYFLAEAKLSNFWQLIVDEKKQIFTSEKFLLMASEDGKFLPTAPLVELKVGVQSLWQVFRQDPLPRLPVVLTSQPGPKGFGQPRGC